MHGMNNTFDNLNHSLGIKENPLNMSTLKSSVGDESDIRSANIGTHTFGLNGNIDMLNNLRDIPTFRGNTDSTSTRRTIDDYPKNMSKYEKNIKDKERSICFDKFLR